MKIKKNIMLNKILIEHKIEYLKYKIIINNYKMNYNKVFKIIKYCILKYKNIAKNEIFDKIN